MLGCRLRALAPPFAAAALAVLAACGAGSALPIQRQPSPPARLADGPPTHIAVIVMENEEYGDVVGSGSAPYINSLARRSAPITGMYAIFLSGLRRLRGAACACTPSLEPLLSQG